jgi:hypothetical protein
MRINKRIQGAVVAIALLSVGLTTLSAEAKPKHGHHHNNGYKQGHYDARYNQDRYDQGRYDESRYNDDRYNDRYNDRRERSRRDAYYPGSYRSSLPSGCRRVVVRNRTYYATPNNNAFFTYSPARNLYIVVNNPFRFF